MSEKVTKSNTKNTIKGRKQNAVLLIIQAMVLTVRRIDESNKKR